MPKQSSKTAPRDEILLLIAIFKFFKALLFIGVGIGLLSFLHRDISKFILKWVELFRIDPEKGVVQSMLKKADWFNNSKLKLLGAGSFIYAALFFSEGIGLWLQKRWGEYLTLFITGSFIPFEIFELVKKLSWPRGLILAINLATVAYLIYRLIKPEKKK